MLSPLELDRATMTVSRAKLLRDRGRGIQDPSDHHVIDSGFFHRVSIYCIQLEIVKELSTFRRSTRDSRGGPSRV